MKAFVYVVAMTLALGACAGVPKEQLPTRTVVLSKCPVLKKYTPEQLKKAADELKGLASDSQLALLLTDYSLMRDACRAMAKKLKENEK